MVSTCPHCGKRLKAKDALAGKQVVCPVCNREFAIAEIAPGAGKAQQTRSQSSERARAADAMSGSGTDTGRPASVHDPEASSGGSMSTTETQRDSYSTPIREPVRRASQRNLFLATALVFSFICAIVAARVVYLHREAEGPLMAYVIPHVDDIDGGINQDWFLFFCRLREWHDRNSIPVCLAFYPETMGDEGFNRIIADMYTSENIELVLKGEAEYQGRRLDQMSSGEAQRVLEAWKGKFVMELEGLGLSDIQPPIAYNQLMMGLTEAIRDAAHETQLRVFLELGESEHGYIDMLPDFDVTQYSVSLTRSGQAGPAEEFKTTDEVIEELLGFQHDRLIYINGVKVIPLLCNQRDFRRSEDSLVLNEKKWETYTSLLRRVAKDSRIRLLTARDVYNLRHPGETHNAPGSLDQ